MLLANKKALITGGSEGIGYAIAQAFLVEGAKIAITGRSMEKLQKAQAELEVNVDIFTADASKIDNLEKMFDQYCGNQAKLDILVANAGISFETALPDTTEDDFDKMIATNLKGVFFTVQKAIPFLNNGASIILISSIAGKIGPPLYSIYAATKAGVTSFAQSFAGELAPKKIRVNSISPGFVITPILDKLGLSEEERQNWIKLVPLKRLGLPKDIANAAVFLASDLSDFITATDMVIDGGLCGTKLL